MRVFPQEVNVTIDSKIESKTGLFSNASFVQNLLPGNHFVLIKKDGYYDYQKTLGVKGKEVTKLERVVLFKQHIPFTVLEDMADHFYMAPNEKNALVVKAAKDRIDFETLNLANATKSAVSLAIKNADVSNAKWSDDSTNILIKIQNDYYILEPFLATLKITKVFSPKVKISQVMLNPQDSSRIFFLENNDLYLYKKSAPVIKDVVVYRISNNTITWLSRDGFLYTADTQGNFVKKISDKEFLVKTASQYDLTLALGLVFLQEDTLVWLFDQSSESFKKLYSPVNEIAVSPDGQKILFSSDKELWYVLPNIDIAKKIPLSKLSNDVSQAQWLGNDYIVFAAKNTIMISEIDARGNVNTIALPQKISLSDASETILADFQIFFNQQDKKLYVVNQKNLLVSEKMIP